MTNDSFPSSVYRIKDAIDGYPVTYFFCVEPGAFQCMSPVYLTLKQEGKSVQWVGGGWFLEQNPSGEKVIHLEQFYQEVLRHDPETVCVVLGSHATYSITQECIRFCHAQHLFSFFLFDHWCNLELHFLDQKNKILHLPNRIGAVDEVGKNALWDALLPYHPDESYLNQIMVVGQPSIENTVKKIQSVSAEEIQSFRFQLNAVDCELSVFLMEPNCEDFGLEPYDVSYLGYTEYTTLDYVLKQERKDGGVLVIKPHPRQNMDVFQSCIQQYSDKELRGCFVITDKPLELIIAAADRVLGMTTVVLIMALKAGKPIVSIQKNRTERGKKMSNIYFENYLVK